MMKEQPCDHHWLTDVQLGDYVECELCGLIFLRRDWGKKEQELKEDIMAEEFYSEVVAIQDDSGHWYVLPKELKNDFYIDIDNDDLVDSGEFDNKYGQYRTGGALNLVQLYIKQIV